MSENSENIGVSLIRVVKELAGRVRLLEEVIRSNPALATEFDKQVSYKAAYEEDEYQRLVAEMQRVLEQLSKIGPE